MLSRWAISHPVTVSMIFLAILLLGGISYFKLPLDLLPQIEPPAISVITMYPGASAQDVEEKVTKYIEDAVSTVNNLEHIISRSKESVSIVTAQFSFGTDLDAASNDIRDKIDTKMRKLPTDIERPILFKFSSSMMPVLIVSFISHANFHQLHYLVDKKVSDYIKRVPGVGAVIINSPYKRAINIKLDYHKMIAYGLTPQLVAMKLKQANLMLPAGSIKDKISQFMIRVPEEYKDVNEIRNTILLAPKGNPVYLKDIAEVEDLYKEKKLDSYSATAKSQIEPGIFLMIQKKSGSNTVEVVRNVRRELSKIQKRLGVKDLKYAVILDSSEFILSSMKNLKSTIVLGILLVVFVTFFFLRDLRATSIIILTIPFSIIITFIFMYGFGYTLNMMSLMALGITSGMVVDNAVVVLENIDRYRLKGVKTSVASYLGSREVGSAILGSSLTTVVIFVPIIFMTGIVGVFFGQMGSIIIIAIMASLFSSLTLTPMVSSLLLKEKSGFKKSFFLIRWSEKFLSAIENFYAKLVGRLLKIRWLAVIVLMGTFILSMVWAFRHLHSEFMPKEDAGNLQISAVLKVGTKLEVTSRVLREIIKIVKDTAPELVGITGRAGQTEEGFASALGMKEGPNEITIWAKLKPLEERKRGTPEIAEILRKKISHIPEIFKYTVDPGNPVTNILFAGAKPITIEILGYDQTVADKLAKEIKAMVKSTPGAVDVAISKDPGKPEYHVNFNRQKMEMLGLTVAQVAMILRDYFYGAKVGKFRSGGDEYDIFMQLAPQFRFRAEDIGNIEIPLRNGKSVKLKTFATVKKSVGPIEIERKDKERIIKVEADIAPGSVLSEVVNKVKHKLAQIKIPDGFEVQFGGDVEEQRKSFRDLKYLLLLSITLVYMVMASLYESLVDPFVIMFALPFAFTGVFLGLALTGQALNIVSFLGLIILMGIAVNNAIVMVDFINLLRERGMNKTAAIVESCRRRLRPILITTFTTIFGMLPMVFSTGSGHETYRPLGISVVAGLSISTLVTLFLVPLIYSIMKRGK
jgi:hydrophobe/amphiphile efflux-1 (HAE1) family protein